MANTHDYSIANDTGSAVRTDLNTLFTEIEAANAGASAPTNLATGKLWYDTGNNLLKQYDGSSWVTIMDSTGGTFTGAVTASAGLDVSAGTLTTSTAQKQTISSTTFASGTKMLFNQTAAPTGWTKVTSSNDVALRLTSGTVGTGGTVAFETAFASKTVATHTLSIAEMPSHTHLYKKDWGVTNQNGDAVMSTNTYVATRSATEGEGGGAAHGHGSIDLNVSYVDVIIATKD